jgi:hypothetical protein
MNGNHPGETQPAPNCRRCPSRRRPRPPTFERVVRSDGHAIRDTFEGISQPLRMNRRTDDDKGDYSLSRETLPSGPTMLPTAVPTTTAAVVLLTSMSSVLFDDVHNIRWAVERVPTGGCVALTASITPLLVND